MRNEFFCGEASTGPVVINFSVPSYLHLSAALRGMVCGTPFRSVILARGCLAVAPQLLPYDLRLGPVVSPTVLRGW